MAGLTGAPFFDRHRFLQYVEGPIDGLTLAYGRIRASRSHFALEELVSEMIVSRRCPYWSMALLPATSEEVSGIAHIKWDESALSRVPIVHGESGLGSFVELLERHVSDGTANLTGACSRRGSMQRPAHFAKFPQGDPAKLLA
ncbi:BLUF domain-containing protein [Xanthomonas arboricola]|uniref:BLUF domain-containing protein n=1 Tax=Xanthomonas arboricola TaxID=56448 RepID=UPI003CCEADF4